MSTRNPQNKRTQEKMQGSLGGMARKSASSAKPARPAAGSVHVVPSSSKAKRAQVERGEDLSGLSKEEKKARKAELRAQEDRIYAVADTLMKENPRYSKLRRIWWVLLVVGIAALLGTWVVMGIAGSTQTTGTAQIVLLVIAYAAIIAAFIFDMWKIRPVRNEARAAAEGMGKARMDEVLARRSQKK